MSKETNELDNLLCYHIKLEEQKDWQIAQLKQENQQLKEKLENATIKYCINDSVYIINNNNIVSGCVLKIELELGQSPCYGIAIDDQCGDYSLYFTFENNIFSTEQEAQKKLEEV